MRAKEISELVAEDKRRVKVANAPFNPITGEGSVGERTRLEISDFRLKVQYVPDSMLDVPLVKRLLKYGSFEDVYRNAYPDREYTPDIRSKLIDKFVRIRIKHDFPFWAAYCAWIKPKGGGDDVHFRLNRPQRRLVARLERMRLAGKPIRIILLKARQWGGSTLIQMYMAWLQLVHDTGLNSLIVGHVSATSIEVEDMFSRMLRKYPTRLLYPQGASYKEGEPTFTSVFGAPNIHRIPQRNCKIKLGTAENPESARGGDYNLVHCTEVGVWKKTDGKSPEDIIQAATSGIPLAPHTMIVYESTAKGTGNWFHMEYTAAKEGRSQFEAVFVPWYEIEMYSLPLTESREEFARWLWENRENRNAASDREEPGSYYWYLWECGATFESINWYREERKKYHDHGQMASEYPSDDVEAFVHSGSMVFDRYNVEKLRPGCRSPKAVGDVYADGIEGKAALSNVRFAEDRQGELWVWQHPEILGEGERCTERYLAVVDVGGRAHTSDWSVIVVFDRYWMMEGQRPSVVAQWYGHIDMDRLAWKAAQIAAYYDNALLVIESNTLETKDRDRIVDGDQSLFILNQIKETYPNLYARKQSPEDIAEHVPVKYGFHTNIATKPMVISTLVKAIREHLYTERDARCLDEYLCYERKQNGSFGAILGKHDDLLMTRAIGLHICFNEMGVPRIVREGDTKVRHKAAVSAATL